MSALSKWACAALLWLALPCAGWAQLSVEQPWVRATVAAQKASGAFMTLTASENSRLVAASSPVAGVVELHEMRMVDEMMRMRQIPGLDLPAGQAVALEPGGYHIMLLELKHQLKEGDSVPLTLLIDDAHGRRRTVTVNAVVRPLNQTAAPPTHATPAAAMPAMPAVPTVQVRAAAAATIGGRLPGGPASVNDIAQSVTRVDMRTLREQGGATLLDALRNVPGASADFGFNGSHAQAFVLRGFLADSGTGSSRVLRDGARLSNYPFVPAFAESVQVLRGPGAAVGTRGEPGGTVDIVTKQAQSANFGAAHLGAGANGQRELSLDLNRVLSEERQLAARVIVDHAEASEWRHVPDRLDGIKLAVAQDGGRAHHLRLGYEQLEQRYRPDYGVPALNGRPAPIPLERQLSEPWAASTLRNRIVDLHADVDLDQRALLAMDATHLEAVSTSVRQALGTPLAGAPGRFARVTTIEPGTHRRIDSVATSLGATRPTGELTHTLYAGAEYYRELLDQPSAVAPAANSPPIDIFQPVYGVTSAPGPLPTRLARENLDSTIVTLQDQIDWNGSSLVAGVQHMKQRFFYGGVDGGDASDERRWSPKLALLHHVSPERTVYAGYASGAAPNQAASASGRSLPSRTARQYEVGAKGDWRERALHAEAVLFWLEQNHMLADDPATDYAFDKTVSGAARSRGLELSLNGALAPHLSLEGAYAATFARYRDGSEFSGKSLPNVARHSLNLFGHYDWDDHWRSGLGWSVQSQRFADQANTTTLPGYGRWDATHAYRVTLSGRRSLEWQLSVRNLFNKRYYEASHLHVTRYILPGAPRGMNASAYYRF